MAREKRIRGLPYEQWMEGAAAEETPLQVEIVEWDRTGASSAIQCVAADLTVVAAYGSSTSTAPVYCAPIMGNLIAGVAAIGDNTAVNLSATANMMAGVIGKYSHVGTNASTYPASAVRAEIGSESTAAYAAVLAVIGGDTGLTTATAAFSVDNQNSLATSGFLYGLDLLGNGTHDGYQAMAFRSGGADIRLNSGGLIVSLTTAITGGTTTTTYAAGTLGKTTHSTGRASLFVSDATKWQFLTNA